MTHWLDKIGIDKTCRLVAMCRGMITLTKTDDETHTVWIYDHSMFIGDRRSARTVYASFCLNETFAKLYR